MNIPHVWKQNDNQCECFSISVKSLGYLKFLYCNENQTVYETMYRKGFFITVYHDRRGSIGLHQAVLDFFRAPIQLERSPTRENR